MKFAIKRIDPTALSPEDRDAIDQVLIRSRNATVFHTLEWNNLLISEFDLRNITLLASQNQQPVGLYSFYIDTPVCRSPLVSLESVYGGPISIGDSRVVVELLKQAEQLQRMSCFEIWTPASYDISSIADRGYSSREMYTSVLDLGKSEEELWSGMDAKRRNTIRKATRNGVVIVDGNSSNVDAYYAMVESTFTRAGIHILPKSYYVHVVEQLGPIGMARLRLAQHEGRFIAGAIFLFYKDTAYYWHGASHREYLGVAPNELIQWDLIQWAKQNGYKFYDFVRIEPDRLPGIARFKMSFGGASVPCYRLQKITPGYQLWRMLRLIRNPIRVVKKLQNVTVRNGVRN